MELKAKHLKAQIFNYTEWIELTRPDALKKTYQKRLENAGFTIVKFDEFYFPEKGYTCFWLLAESHLAIHTFPDANKAYVELSSCNEAFLESFKKKAIN
jgi:S-adenosylmethionine decarboxylase